MNTDLNQEIMFRNVQYQISDEAFIALIERNYLTDPSGDDMKQLHELIGIKRQRQHDFELHQI